MIIRSICVAGVLCAPFPGVGSAQAQDACPGGAVAPAQVVAIEGAVRLTSATGDEQALAVGHVLCPGDRVRTGDASAIDIRFESKDSVTSILSSSTILIPESGPDVTLSNGLLRFISSVRGAFRIGTPHADAGIDGTEAMIVVDGPAADTLILVREGVVKGIDARKAAALPLRAGEAAYASARTALVRATAETVPEKFRGYLLNPEGAADWAVYYPPIRFAGDDPLLLKATALLDGGDPDAAEVALANVASGDALALRAVVAVLRNRTEQARQLSDQAISVDPANSSAHIAQSYARQAVGELNGALDAARKAAALAPRDAFALARMAELELTLGHRAQALAAAQASVQVDETGLGQAVLGFAALSAGDVEAAETAFGKAIVLDSGAPLPRLGLGLAKIQRGDLAGGRREIETAAALDPQRSQVRTWLGRAYAEEGLSDKAATQYQLAQEMDPDDPTPWLGTAGQRFAAGRPVQALAALEQANERAEGRATLRGRAGLGEDQATRETAFGRIYDQLGFQNQAGQAAARSVSADPVNPGAHRFLADVYRARPGFEIAQTSELLKAQLLSGPSKSPVQPRLSEPDLALLNTTGPVRTTFHEFAPLFDGNGIAFIGATAVGNNAVIEDELSLSILHDGVSLAVGQFHAQTAGFRANDDIRHDVVAIEAKVDATPWLTLTGEARFRETVQGDRFLRSFNTPTTVRNETEEERAQFMLGGHAELTPTNDLLFFGVVAETDLFDESRFADPFFGPVFLTDDSQTQSLSGEIQDIQRFDWGTLLIGATVSTSRQGGVLDSDPTAVTSVDTDQVSGYFYGTFSPFEQVELTLGVSLDQVETSEQLPGFDAFFNPVTVTRGRDELQLNPKAGLSFEPVPGVILRGAYTRTLKREAIQDRTLEPTTLAGFNQFYDDPDQTDAQMFAGGADIKVLDNLWIGGEYIYRTLDIPDFDLDPVTFNNVLPVTRDGRERIARGYVNATFGQNWAASLGVEYSQNETELLDRPDVVDTLLIPASIRYFDDSGVFGGIEAVFFDQQSTGQADGGVDGLLNIDTDEQGVVLNAAIGYRFQNSRGIAALEVNNILDSSFALQNSLNNSARPSTRPLAEGLSVIGRVTFGF